MRPEVAPTRDYAQIVRCSTEKSCLFECHAALRTGRHSPRLFKSVQRHLIRTADLCRQVRCSSDDLGVVAAGAFKRANIEPGRRAHLPRKVHRSVAFRAMQPARQRRVEYVTGDKFRDPASGSRALHFVQKDQAV